MRRQLPRRNPIGRRRLLPHLRRVPRLLHAGRFRHAVRRLRPLQEPPKYDAQELAGRVRGELGILHSRICLRVGRELVRGGNFLHRDGELLPDGTCLLG